MGVVHNHLLIRAEVQQPFTKPRVVKKWLKELVAKIGMKICKHGGPHVDYVDVPGNAGIAAVVMIETSHCSIHIWDQISPPLVQMDVYSCAPFDSNVVLDHLEVMKPTSVLARLYDRATGIEQVRVIECTAATTHIKNQKPQPPL